MKEKSKLLLVTTLWIITLIILVIDIATPIFKSKPSYYCKEDDCNVFLDYFMPNCIDSIITSDSTETILIFDITNMGDSCNIVWSVSKSVISEFKEGDSMVCNVPMDIAIDKEKYYDELLKYCEGSLKDILIRENY